MKVKLDFGAELDVLTQGELEQTLSKAAALWWERARGVRYVRRVSQPAAASVVVNGPDQGWAWDVKLVGAVFSAADSLQVLLGAAALWPVWAGPPGNAGATNVLDSIIWGSHQVILNPGEQLTVKSAGGALISNLLVAAIEVPAERLGLILS